MTGHDRAAAARRATDEDEAFFDDGVPDVPPDPPEAAGVTGAGTGLRRPDESDAYGLEVAGAGDVVHSDTVGAAELSSEYTAGMAATDSDTDVDEAERAWDEAAEDSREP